MALLMQWLPLCLALSVAIAKPPSYLLEESLTGFSFEKSFSIEATFRYLSASQSEYIEYFVTQYLSKEHSSVRMDISAAVGSDKFQIYYSALSPKRYLVRDGSITELIWPDIDKSQKSAIGMANEIFDFFLVLGPEKSLTHRIFRTTDLTPKKGESRLIDGINCSISTFLIEPAFTATYYEPDDTSVSRSQQAVLPKFVTFVGSMGSGGPSYTVEYDIFDVKSYSFPDLLNIPTILPPGLGDKSKILKDGPWLQHSKRQRLTVLSSDVSKNKQKKFELFYDLNLNYSRIESLDDETATVFDINLGVKYDFTSDSDRSTCTITTIDPKSYLLFTAFNFVSPRETFLGSMFCVFEKYFYNYTLEDVKYDLFIVVFYMEDLGEDSSANPWAGIDFFGYKKEEEKYQLTLQLRNDFFSRGSSSSGLEIYETKFHVKYCFPDPSQRMLIVAEYIHNNNDTTHLATKDTSDDHKRLILDSVREESIFSLVRLADMDIDWFGDRFVANLLVVDKPRIDKSFIVTNIDIDPKKLSSALTYGELQDCMRSSSYSGRKKFIACKEPKKIVCQSFKEDADLSDLKGTSQCQLFENAASTASRVTKELDIFENDRWTSSFFRRVLTGTFYPGFTLARLFFRDYLKNDEREEIFIGKKIYIGRWSIDYVAKDVKTLSECKQACQSHRYLDCTGFSFCEASKNFASECILTSSRQFERTLVEAKNLACSAIGLSSLSFYEKTLSGRYVLEKSYRKMSGSLQNCAKECTHDNKCQGFLTTPDDKGVLCSFSDKLNPELTPYPRDATYYSVRLDYNFNNPSPKLATEVSATYSNVSFKRCADLCYKSKYTECVSFNYCQTSDCQLSSKRISEQGTKSMDNCYSYERDQNMKGQSSASSSKIESISTIEGFWIVIAFCFGGLLLGAGLMFLYSKSMFSGEMTFSLVFSGWQRHRDEPL